MTTGTRGPGWSAGIIGAFAVFMVVMIVMIVISMRSTVDLVEEGYYEEGLTYERHIEAVRTARAEGDVAVTAAASGIRLAFPPDAAAAGIRGDVTLYRPSDRGQDRHVALSPDSAGIQHIPAAGLLPGLWKVKVLWSTPGGERYSEQAILLP
jgi:nitrogen fixation protein FixH